MRVSAQFYAEQPTTDDPALFVPEPAVLPEAEALAITGRWGADHERSARLADRGRHQSAV